MASWKERPQNLEIGIAPYLLGSELSAVSI